MTYNLNFLLIDLLYAKSNNKLDSDIYNTIISLWEKHNFKTDYLYNTTKNFNTELVSNYDVKSSGYFADFFASQNYLNYYASSLTDQCVNLNHNNLKALASFKKTESLNNKFIAINYSNDQDKNDLVKYMISNILIDDFLNSYYAFLNEKVHNQNTINEFLRTSFKVPKILLTGFDKETMDETTDPCKIWYPHNQFWTFLRCRMYIPQLHNIFYSLNINLVDNENNIDKKVELQERYWLWKRQGQNEELQNNYISMCSEFFNKQDIKWEEIPNLLFERIQTNIDSINYLNKLLKKSIILDQKINLKSLKNKFDFIDELISTLNEKNINSFSESKLIKENIDLIQNKLNEKLRSENIFMYRHLCEWIFLDSLIKYDQEEIDFKTLNYLKPVISSNLENFCEVIKTGIWNNNQNELEQFDYVLINDTNELSWKYLPFFTYAFKNIIAFGNSKQLKDNELNDSIKNIYKIFTHYEQNDWNMKYLDEMFSKMNLTQASNNKSIFNWILDNTKTKSLIKEDNEIKIENGIHL